MSSQREWVSKSESLTADESAQSVSASLSKSRPRSQTSETRRVLDRADDQQTIASWLVDGRLATTIQKS
jgi:hypothetical protein